MQIQSLDAYLFIFFIEFLISFQSNSFNFLSYKINSDYELNIFLNFGFLKLKSLLIINFYLFKY